MAVYVSKYDKQAQDIAKEIAAIKKSMEIYNAAESQEYKTYEDQAKRNIDTSTRELIAKYGGSSGGTPNSYATASAAQAANAYTKQLSDMIPTLAAQYKTNKSNEISNLLGQLNDIRVQDQNDYARWADQRDYNFTVQKAAQARADALKQAELETQQKTAAKVQEEYENMVINEAKRLMEIDTDLTYTQAMKQAQTNVNAYYGTSGGTVKTYSAPKAGSTYSVSGTAPATKSSGSLSSSTVTASYDPNISSLASEVIKDNKNNALQPNNAAAQNLIAAANEQRIQQIMKEQKVDRSTAIAILEELQAQQKTLQAMIAAASSQKSGSSSSTSQKSTSKSKNATTSKTVTSSYK